MDDGGADVGVVKISMGSRPRALNQPSMLVLDTFKGHLTDYLKNHLRNMKIEFVVIPGGMTSVLQPEDVSINKPFKDRLRQKYLTWIADPARGLTETGEIKRAAPSEVVLWCRLHGKPPRRALSSDFSRYVA